MNPLFFTVLLVSSIASAQPSCGFVGDSIAWGASQYDKRCFIAAKQGITARQWVARYPNGVQADKVLVSIGSNDQPSDRVHLDILAMRRTITAREVLWIAPGPQFAASRASVLWVASVFNDAVYERPYNDLAPDGVHFTRRGYAKIARIMEIIRANSMQSYLH